MVIVIEPATQTDLPGLVALLRALFTQEAEFRPDAELQRRGLEMILSSPTTGQIFVARENGPQGSGDVIGMINLLFTVSTALGAPVCWLEDMVVHPDARGDGIGGQLIEHAITFAREQQYRRITLMTDRNNDDARAFYLRHGFVTSDMVAMRRPLP
jgi:GNAT superfamily N-acetyltransferase